MEYAVFVVIVVFSVDGARKMQIQNAHNNPHTHDLGLDVVPPEFYIPHAHMQYIISLTLLRLRSVFVINES